jgi:hypothetical protein
LADRWPRSSLLFANNKYDAHISCSFYLTLLLIPEALATLPCLCLLVSHSLPQAAGLLSSLSSAQHHHHPASTMSTPPSTPPPPPAPLACPPRPRGSNASASSLRNNLGLPLAAGPDIMLSWEKDSFYAKQIHTQLKVRLSLACVSTGASVASACLPNLFSSLVIMLL